jgi:hypothetical protein
VPASHTELNESLSVQPCPTAQEVAEASTYFQTYAVFAKEGLDLIKRGEVPSLHFHAFFLAGMWRPTKSCKLDICASILVFHILERYL